MADFIYYETNAKHTLTHEMLVQPVTSHPTVQLQYCCNVSALTCMLYIYIFHHSNYSAFLAHLTNYVLLVVPKGLKN
jgi:hypothetical protein